MGLAVLSSCWKVLDAWPLDVTGKAFHLFQGPVVYLYCVEKSISFSAANGMAWLQTPRVPLHCDF